MADKVPYEEKIRMMVDFALAFKNDPDFHRLVFPEVVLVKLRELGVEPKPKEYSATQAVDKCFSIPGTEAYSSSKVEVRDQTSLSIAFPKIPEKVDSTDTTETKSPELAGLSSVLTLDDEKGTSPS